MMIKWWFKNLFCDVISKMRINQRILNVIHWLFISLGITNLGIWPFVKNRTREQRLPFHSIEVWMLKPKELRKRSSLFPGSCSSRFFILVLFLAFSLFCSTSCCSASVVRQKHYGRTCQASRELGFRHSKQMTIDLHHKIVEAKSRMTSWFMTNQLNHRQSYFVALEQKLKISVTSCGDYICHQQKLTMETDLACFLGVY